MDPTVIHHFNLTVFEAGGALGSIGVEDQLLLSRIIMDTYSTRYSIIVLRDIESIMRLRLNLGCCTVARPLDHSQAVGVRIERAIILNAVSLHL